MSKPRQMRFVMIGATGFIAPRHLQAIKAVGGTLVAIHNRGQNVGFLNEQFPDCKYFPDAWRFLRFLGRLQMEHVAPDYGVICTPNWLHDPQAVTLMKYGMDVIVEKPTCVRPENVDVMQQFETAEGHRVWTTLQTKHHPAIRRLQARVARGFHRADLHWETPREEWYYPTWKNREEESGGLIYNIGVHFLHVLIMLFGANQKLIVQRRDAQHVVGSMLFERAHVDFDLSIAPRSAKQRTLTVDGRRIDLTQGFERLHTVAYREILAGRGIGLDEVRPAIQLAYGIQRAKVTPSDMSE